MTDPRQYLEDLKKRKAPEGISHTHQDDFHPSNSFLFYLKPIHRGDDNIPLRIFFDDVDEFWKIDFFEQTVASPKFSHFEIRGRVMWAITKEDGEFAIGIFDYPVQIPERFWEK